MENPINWKTKLSTEITSIKLDCNRCNTKSTHAQVLGTILSEEAYVLDPLIAHKEIFYLIKCSTCNSITIKYETYKGGFKYFFGTESPRGINRPKPNKGGIPEFKLINTKYFPVSCIQSGVPAFIETDYQLMHLCHQIGSTQGVAVHCRRILDKIFMKFEKKYLTKEDKEDKKDIKTRSKIISNKCVYFSPINEVIKNLKGILSIIVHKPEDELAYIDLKDFSEATFTEINQILDAIIKVYELDFNTLKKLEEKYQEIKNTETT